MIFHTIVPYEWVFPITSDEKYEVLIKSYGSMLLHVRNCESDQALYEIVRIESTNPADYLTYAPGQIVKL